MNRSSRYSDLTWPEVRDAADRGAIIGIPIGATEQHGPHLPLSTDVLIPEALAFEIAQELDVLVAPSIAYGNRSRPLAGGGEGFPGTVSVSAAAFMQHLEDVILAFAKSGFRKIVLLNWHYENSNFVYEAAYVARERAAAPDLRIMVCEATFAGISDAVVEKLFGAEFPGWDVEHAAVLETSIMLHLRPDLVLMDRAVDDEARRHPSYDVVPPPADFVTASGALWKATRATTEKGRAAWADIVERMIGSIDFELGEERAPAPGY
jgi:creatinine amidohydrolase